MKGFLGKLRRSAFVRNVAILASGTALAQAITILAAPILSRIYDPGAFGVLGVLLAVANPVAIMASFKYELAIVLAKDDTDAAGTFVLSSAIVVLVSLITLLVALTAGDWIGSLLGYGAVAPLLVLIPAMVLAQGLNSTILWWANRRRSYTWTSVSMISRSASTVAFQVVMGLLQAGANGLVLGRILGATVATIVLGGQIARQDLRLVRASLDLSRLKRLAREHDQFPKYNMPREVLVELSGSFPSLFLAALFGPAAAGLYWFTVRLLEAPTTLLGVAVRRVFYERAAVAHHRGEDLLPLLVRATAALAAIGVVPALILLVAAPDLFEVVFGYKWRDAGVYAQWLVLWWFTSFCNVATATLIPILLLQRPFLVIEIVGIALRGGAIFVAVFFGTDLTAIALYALVGMSLNLFRIAYVFWHAAALRRRKRRAPRNPSVAPPSGLGSRRVP